MVWHIVLQKFIERRNSMIKRFVCILLGVLIVFSLVGCDLEPVERPEQPHLYWKDIDVVVTNVNRKHWFATTHHYIIEITVKSEEYGLEKTITSEGGGMFAPQHWGVEKGDVVTAQLYSWVMDSTGEVVRRDIHSLK